MFIDVVALRENRQPYNNKMVKDALMRGDIGDAPINMKEFDRALDDLGFDREELFSKCATDEEFSTVFARLVSVKAHRQGSKDETLILDAIAKEFSETDIVVKSLSARAVRPHKNGTLVYNEKDTNNVLKSFDGQITGKVEGWIFAKVVVGIGGHQDNVESEACEFGDWAVKFGKDSLYFILIDGDEEATKRRKRLADRYDEYPNIMVVDHVELQDVLRNNV